MIFRFLRNGLWWEASQFTSGLVKRYYFVWPMVITWLKDQIGGRDED